MELMREKWTDERLDDLNDKVDDLGREWTAASTRSTGASNRSTAASNRSTGASSIDERLDSINRVMLQGYLAMGVAMATGFVTLAGLIVSRG